MKLVWLFIFAVLCSWATAQEQSNVVKRIVVDIQRQQLRALENGKQVYQFHCCTGRNNRTPRGAFKVQAKVRSNRALKKYGGASTPYTLRLGSHIGIHAFKSVPSRPASHGCIRLRYADAQKLYGWTKVGLSVTIK